MTGLPQTDLNPDVAVQAAAEWLANTRDHASGRPAVPELKTRFGITALEAVEAIRRAQAIRWGRAS